MPHLHGQVADGHPWVVSQAAEVRCFLVRHTYLACHKCLTNVKEQLVTPQLPGMHAFAVTYLPEQLAGSWVSNEIKKQLLVIIPSAVGLLSEPACLHYIVLSSGQAEDLLKRRQVAVIRLSCPAVLQLLSGSQ